jgi:hypothetical protein
VNRRTVFTLTTMALLGLAVTLPEGDAVAQQKQRVSFKAPAENSKYTQQSTIDVGDVPGHQVRVFEIHRSYPSNPPMINGVALKEQFQRGTSDFTDYNGLSSCAGFRNGAQHRGEAQHHIGGDHHGRDRKVGWDSRNDPSIGRCRSQGELQRDASRNRIFDRKITPTAKAIPPGFDRAYAVEGASNKPTIKLIACNPSPNQRRTS